MDSLNLIMIRDKIKNKEYFEYFIDDRCKSIEKRVNKLKIGQINADRIVPVKQAMSSSYLQIVSAKFSLGIKSIEKMKIDVFHGIKFINEALHNNFSKLDCNIYLKEEKVQSLSYKVFEKYQI